MVSEDDSKPHFLNCYWRERECDCMLTSTVCRKPTHTDRYLHLSHQPIHYNKEYWDGVSESSEHY